MQIFCSNFPLFLTWASFDKLSLLRVSSSFPHLYRYHVEHCDNVPHAKSFIFAKEFWNIVAQSCYFWFWRWFICSTFLYFLVKWLQLENPSCNAHQMLITSGYFFLLTSFLGVVAVILDRFLAVNLRLRQRNLWQISVWLLQWSLCGCIEHLFLWEF